MLTFSVVSVNRRRATCIRTRQRSLRNGWPVISAKHRDRWPAVYAAWSKAVDYLCWLGSHFTNAHEKRQRIVAAMEAIGEHERTLSKRLLHGSDGLRGLLNHPAVTVHGEMADLSHRDPVFAFQIEGMSSKKVVARFAEKRISVFNRVSDAYSRHTLQALGTADCVRVSLCHYHTSDEVGAFLAALEEIAS
jgi:cysteine desulfurase / selenocysteine lyase